MTPQDRWQPIATAPTDGTEVLITNGKSIYLAHWDPCFESEWDEAAEETKYVGQWTDGTVVSFAYEETNKIENPTHWQPLPDPPPHQIAGGK